MNETMPFISVVIPFYNLDDCVEYCLRSVLSQTYRNFEIVCVDDGSTDETPKLIRQFAQDDDRVRLLEQTNRGQAYARNAGVAAARGDYIVFIDGDDYVVPVYLDSLVQAMQINPNCMAITGFVDITIHSNSEAVPRPAGKAEACWGTTNIDELLYRDLVSCCWGRIAPKELYRNHPLNQRYYEDVAIGAEYLSDCSTVLYLDEPLYYHVRRPGSTVNAKRVVVEQVSDYMKAIEKQTKDLETLGASDNAVRYMRALQLTRAYRNAMRSDKSDEVVTNAERLCLTEVRSNLRLLLGDSKIPQSNKARFAVFAHAPALYDSLFNLFVGLRNKRYQQGRPSVATVKGTGK